MDLPWWGILLCAALGIIVGIQSGILTTLLYKIEDFSRHCQCTGWGALLWEACHRSRRPDRAAGTRRRLRYYRGPVKQQNPYGSRGDNLAGEGGNLARRTLVGNLGRRPCSTPDLRRRAGQAGRAPLPGDPGFWALLGMAAMMGAPCAHR
jgi:CIC family chloride channel protein